MQPGGQQPDSQTDQQFMQKSEWKATMTRKARCIAYVSVCANRVSFELKIELMILYIFTYYYLVVAIKQGNGLVYSSTS